MIRAIGSYIDKFLNPRLLENLEMTYELIEAIKREFWPGYKEKKDLEQAEQMAGAQSEEKEDNQPKCDYCGNNISTRAYRMHGKVICSPCLNSRFDDYTSKTFKKITNKSLDDVRNKI